MESAVKINTSFPRKISKNKEEPREGDKDVKLYEKCPQLL
jgi:hypothetical protein